MMYRTAEAAATPVYHPTTAPNLRPVSMVKRPRIEFTSEGYSGVSLTEFFGDHTILDNRDDLLQDYLSASIKDLLFLDLKFEHEGHKFTRMPFAIGPCTTIASLVEFITCNIHRLVRVVNKGLRDHYDTCESLEQPERVDIQNARLLYLELNDDKEWIVKVEWSDTE